MINVLLVTKGHPYEREPFYDIFEQMPEVTWTLVEQPAAQALFDVRHAGDYDAFVMYDMPGIQFQPGMPPQFPDPPQAYRSALRELIDAGHGFVFLHHAIAGWPAWPEYADILGGRFLYMADELRGVARQDSGYRHGVTHEIEVVRQHPVTAGVPDRFTMTDELYLYEVFEEDVTPLLRSNYNFTNQNFYSATHAVRDGRMFSNEGWSHAPGSNLVGWCRELGPSRLVYLQGGDDPVAYADANYRKLIHNAIKWVSAKD